MTPFLSNVQVLFYKIVVLLKTSCVSSEFQMLDKNSCFHKELQADTICKWSKTRSRTRVVLSICSIWKCSQDLLSCLLTYPKIVCASLTIINASCFLFLLSDPYVAMLSNYLMTLTVILHQKKPRTAKWGEAFKVRKGFELRVSSLPYQGLKVRLLSFHPSEGKHHTVFRCGSKIKTKKIILHIGWR
jgi:hypothetical protein